MKTRLIFFFPSICSINLFYKLLIKISIAVSIICFFFSFNSCCTKTPNPIRQAEETEQRIENILLAMNLEQKIHLLQGNGMAISGIDSLGIPSLECSDGPFGAHRGGAITSFPCGNALGASWDPYLIAEVAGAIAREAKAKNIHCLLGPGINIIRHPLCGRNFEYYSEDPFLTARLAVSFTKALQEEKVAATLKHFAVNNQEFYRNSLNVIVEERALQEIYLPAFRDAVKEGHAWSVMTAYNKVNGIHCSENKHLLTDILKNEWGFKGFVMPDWAGAHSTVASANNGLDCVVYDSDLFGSQLLKAVQRGEVSEQQITEMARRVLRVMHYTGLMNNPVVTDKSIINSIKHRDINRRAAREGMVLLKNEKNILPLQPNEIKILAVIGPNAGKLRMGGGGSSFVSHVPYQVSPLEGIRNMAGDRLKIDYAQGAGLPDSLIPIAPAFLHPPANIKGERGLWAEYYNNPELKGKPVYCQLDSCIDFIWGESPFIYLSDYKNIKTSNPEYLPQKVGKDSFSVRWTGKIEILNTGYYDFITQSDDGVRLYINDELLIDQWFSHDKEYRYGTIWLEEGKACKIRLEYYEEIGGATIRLGWYYHDPAKLQEAVRLAKHADAVVLCAGIDKFWEAEGSDRTNFDLPLIQDQLIKEIAAVNPNTIVVLNNGGPLNVRPWLDEVPALLEAWFTGNEGGNALADVLFGKYNPSGKLPFSYVQNQNEFPPAFDNYLNRNKTATYKEGIFVGYRYHDKYATALDFPFGFGLSYTSFEYSKLHIEKKSEGEYIARFLVTNTGEYDGAEIAQLYISEKNPQIERPVKELKGFTKSFLKSKETKEFEINLNTSQWQFFNPDKEEWQLNKGIYNIQVGSSSRDIRLTEEITL